MSNLSADDREYYKEVWGLDTEKDRKHFNRATQEWKNRTRFECPEDGNTFRYERDFELENDEMLKKAGVALCARVDCYSGHISNSIIFKHKGNEAKIGCVHQAVYSGTMEDLKGKSSKQFEEMAVSSEGKKLTLLPEEHFIGLCSYVQGLAEQGIESSLKKYYEKKEKELPLHFNSLMFSQLEKAMIEVWKSMGEKHQRNTLNYMYNLVRFNKHQLVEYLIKFAKSPETLIEKLSRNSDDFIRREVASNPKTPLCVLERLAKDKKVMRSVASRADIPEKLIQKLSKYRKNRDILAAKSSTPQKILDKIANRTKVRSTLGEKRQILKDIAENPNTPAKTLYKLSKKSNCSLEYSIAKNPSTPTRILDTLSENDDLHLRALVAKNANVSEETLVKLASDKEKLVRINAAANLKSSVKAYEILAGHLETHKFLLQYHDDIPAGILEKMAENSFCKAEIAAHNNCTPKILKALSNDASEEVRTTVAVNLKTPKATLEKLMEAEEMIVRVSALRTMSAMKYPFPERKL